MIPEKISQHDVALWYHVWYSTNDIIYDTVQMWDRAPRRAVKAFWWSLFCLPRRVVSPQGPDFSFSKITSLLTSTGRRRQRQCKARTGQAQRWAHAPLDNAASSRNKEWSRSMIGAQSSISKTCFFTLMVSSSISLLWTKSEKTTSTSWPKWLFTQWAWHDRNLLTISISAFGSASRSWLHMAHSHQCWSAWWRNKQWAGDICWLQNNAIWTRIKEHQIMGGRSLLIAE